MSHSVQSHPRLFIVKSSDTRGPLAESEVKVKSLSRVRLFATPWTVAHQALRPWDFPGKNIGVGCHFLLQEIFLTQRWNWHLLHWQVDSLPLYHLESPLYMLYYYSMYMALSLGAKCLYAHHKILT